MKNMKRVFLVIGPERSGNHLVKRMFVMAGCEGTYNFNQPLDAFLFKQKKLSDITESQDIVHGDSMPARLTEWTDWVECAKRYEKEGYKIHWIIPVRDFLCIKGAKESVGMIRDSDPISQIQNEYREVFRQVLTHGGFFWLVPISMVLDHPEYAIKEMKILFDLEVPEKFIDKVYDANAKHRRKYE